MNPFQFYFPTTLKSGNGLAIPTTSSTGSECTASTVFTNTRPCSRE
jgi:alcohol dehydrogenase class IV